jgi:hypothetical protein
MLSLYSPSSADQVDWNSGDYRLTVRSGRVDTGAASGTLKKTVRMIAEGGVLAAAAEPLGVAVDVAPDGFVHAVYRSGLALALRLPSTRISVEEERPVEEPGVVEEIAPQLAEPSRETAAVTEESVSASEEASYEI